MLNKLFQEEYMKIHYRRATIDDAEILLEWRNDPDTRQNSFNSQLVLRENHLRWLEGVFVDADRDLYIAEVDGAAVGTLRVDHDNLGQSELSWTVAPDSRGKGIGKMMLIEARNMLPGALVARIKSENIASLSMVYSVGFIFEKEDDGVYYFRNTPI